MNPILKRLIQTAIPVEAAQFHSAVNNADRTPENSFSVLSNSASRRVKMWRCTEIEAYICYQKTARGDDKYWIVENPNVIFSNIPDSFSMDMGKVENACLEAIEHIKSGVPVDMPTAPKKRGRPFKNPE